MLQFTTRIFPMVLWTVSVGLVAAGYGSSDSRLLTQSTLANLGGSGGGPGGPISIVHGAICSQPLECQVAECDGRPDAYSCLNGYDSLGNRGIETGSGATRCEQYVWTTDRSCEESNQSNSQPSCSRCTCHWDGMECSCNSPTLPIAGASSCFSP